MSSISVVFDGKEQTLEEGLDSLMVKVHGGLNNLHMAMRRLASLTEQEIDELDDFKESVEFEDQSFDFVRGIVRNMKDIPVMAREITGKPPAELKEWYAHHVAQRKLKIAMEEGEFKAATDKAKSEMKARIKAETLGAKTAQKTA